MISIYRSRWSAVVLALGIGALYFSLGAQTPVNSAVNRTTSTSPPNSLSVSSPAARTPSIEISYGEMVDNGSKILYRTGSDLGKVLTSERNRSLLRQDLNRLKCELGSHECLEASFRERYRQITAAYVEASRQASDDFLHLKDRAKDQVVDKGNVPERDRQRGIPIRDLFETPTDKQLLKSYVSRGSYRTGGPWSLQGLPFYSSSVSLILYLESLPLHNGPLAAATGQNSILFEKYVDGVRQYSAEITDDPGDADKELDTLQLSHPYKPSISQDVAGSEATLVFAGSGLLQADTLEVVEVRTSAPSHIFGKTPDPPSRKLTASELAKIAMIRAKSKALDQAINATSRVSSLTRPSASPKTPLPGNAQ
jgi:hypothetical protein